MPMPRTIGSMRTFFGQQAYLDKLSSLFGPSIIGFWPQNEAAGTISKDISGRGHNGAYTGVTLGVPGIGDGNTAVSYNGTTSYNNIYSAGLAAALNPLELTIIVWAKVTNVGVWTDGAARFVFAMESNGTNLFRIGRHNVNNQLRFTNTSGGTQKDIIDVSTAFTNYMCLAMTLSKSADQLKAFQNGLQFGSTVTALGTFTGSLAVATIGSVNLTPTGPWSGAIGPVLLLNRAATAAEIAIAAQV